MCVDGGRDYTSSSGVRSNNHFKQKSRVWRRAGAWSEKENVWLWRGRLVQVLVAGAMDASMGSETYLTAPTVRIDGCFEGHDGF